MQLFLTYFWSHQIRLRDDVKLSRKVRNDRLSSMILIISAWLLRRIWYHFVVGTLINGVFG